MDTFSKVCIIGLICTILLLVVILAIDSHDRDIYLENTVDGISCSYLINNFMPEQEQIIFKHPWYPYAVEKIENECQEEENDD